MPQLGKYELIAEIARGGMGRVYLASARGPAGFTKLLVVKDLKPEFAEDASFVTMFLEEARLAARLNHPNIVQTYEIGSEGTNHFIVMDYIEGVPLSRVIARKNPAFTLEMRLRVLCEALRGLHYAHTLRDLDGAVAGIVHRDATPQNVVITYDGQVKLLDFGIAKGINSQVETRAGLWKGKPAYMAPEQLTGNVDPRVDVFAVGVMLWEVVANRRMWSAKTDVEVLSSLLKGDIPRIREAAPHAPEALLRMVEKAVAADRDDRFATAEQFEEVLERYLIETGSNVSARKIGVVIGEIFESERRRMRDAIESYIHNVRSDTGRIPSLPPASLRHGQTGVGSLGSGRHSRAPTLTGTTHLTAQLSNPSGALPEPVRSSPRWTTVAIGALLVMAGAGVAVGVAGWKARTPPSVGVGGLPSAAMGAKMEEAPSVAAPASSPMAHRVVVRVTPSHAAVSIDGETVSNPVSRTCNHGDNILLRMSAAGYVSRDREIHCDRDETVELALALTARTIVVPAPPPPVQASPPPAAPKRPTAEPPAELPMKPPPRQNAPTTIDTGNPWQK